MVILHNCYCCHSHCHKLSYIIIFWEFLSQLYPVHLYAYSLSLHTHLAFSLSLPTLFSFLFSRIYTCIAYVYVYTCIMYFLVCYTVPHSTQHPHLLSLSPPSLYSLYPFLSVFLAVSLPIHSFLSLSRSHIV